MYLNQTEKRLPADGIMNAENKCERSKHLSYWQGKRRKNVMDSKNDFKMDENNVDD